MKIDHNNVLKSRTLLGDAIMLQEGVPAGMDSADQETKLRWVYSQIIGRDVDIETVFGRRKLTYADHTATGRCLRYIEDYILETVLPFYGNTHTSDSYVGERTTNIFNEATEYVKKSLGGTQDDALLFSASGTTTSIKQLQEVMGITIPPILRERVVNSCIASEERWVVFVGPYEHHSNLLSWRQSLAEVVYIGLNDEGLINMDDLQLKLEFYQRTGRPMLGSFSACSNVTGIYSDTRSLSRLLHQFGAFACFDFAASGPYVDIDMRSGAVDGYDAIVLSPHKFLGGPGSPGILLLSKALYQLKNSPPSTCGGGVVNYVNLFNEKHTLYVNDIEEREDAGTPQIIQRVKAALAFQVKEYVGFKMISEKERDYVGRALERLTKNQNIRVLGNTKVERQAIISFLVYNVASSDTGSKKEKPLDGAFVVTLLNDLFGIQARGGCACAGPYGHHLLGINEAQSLEIRSAIEMGYIGAKPGWTRISFPYYMPKEEYEFLLSAIEFISIYGQRFLHVYLFNWNTGSWKLKANAFEEALMKEKVKGCKLCASFSTKELKPVLQVKKGNNSISQKLKECKTTDNNIDDLAKYEFYLEAAKHVGDLLPNFPSECTNIPNSIINPSNVLFRV